MVALGKVIGRIETLLKPELYPAGDCNGIQVEGSQKEISSVAFAVDAGLSIVEKAIESQSELLIVHHGLFWGDVRSLTGPMAKKVALLLSSGTTLYASHLPLDGNEEVGNAFELGRALELKELGGAFPYEGATVGAIGKFGSPTPIEEVKAKLELATGTESLLLPFGNNEINSVGIVTGSGSFAIKTACELSLDLLISGEPKQEAYHTAKELGINALFGGHYATETFGVKALSRIIEKDFGLTTVFIDEPTGI